MLGRERIKLLEEVNHVHTTRIISEFVCAFFFVKFKGSKHMLMLILTIKHCLSHVATLFPLHAEPAVYIFFQNNLTGCVGERPKHI